MPAKQGLPKPKVAGSTPVVRLRTTATPYRGGPKMSATASRIGLINLVMIPSPDQDRSIEFYVEALGFE